MYQLINESRFRDAFHDMGRGEQFSYEGLGRLFEYLEECESGEPEPGMELDVIALCCEYCELTLDEVCEQYVLTEYDADDEDSQRDAVETYLEHRTSLVGMFYVGYEIHVLFAQF